MSTDNKRPKKKREAHSHGAASLGGAGEGGAGDSQGEASSGTGSKPVIASQDEWFSRHPWGTHKQMPGWKDNFKRAKTQWEREQQDLSIASLHVESACPPEEIDAAVKWECLRHLYFSGQLSDFWKAVIEGNHLDALEEHYPGSLRTPSFIFSHDPNDFASPWVQWANTACFPFLPWVLAREEKDFAAILASAEAPSDCVKFLTNYTNTWALAEHWARQQIEDFSRLSATNPQLARDTYGPQVNEPAEIPCTGEKPERVGNENITRLIVEINWDSPKTAIAKAFAKQIEHLWNKRNPNDKFGRGDTERPFFSGLVIRRRLDRGMFANEACEGLYKRRDDTIEGLTTSAKNALKLADERLDETKRALAHIERKLKDG
jgi:hypothetical protein